MSLHLLSRHEAPQGSTAWLTARLGRLTSSRAADMLATRKDKAEAAARRDYRLELVTERLTHTVQDDTFITREMQHGLDMEPKARAVYEATNGALVRESGFAYLDDVMAGTSVDGFVGDDGIVELKCPKSTTHLNYLLDIDAFRKQYAPQCIHHLWVTGRAWVDLCSYDDRFPNSCALISVRIERDAETMDAYGSAARQFLAEVDSNMLAIQRRIDGHEL